ncbi:MAG: anion permease [Candidatus Bathyarchaeota archaeon]|nr:MAG: anion permease [Candidatus Bathyarchaeota archaeon]
MEESVILLIIGWALSFFIAWNLGANDAATPCDTAVGARVISPRNATLLFSIFAAIGSISQGYMNIETISRGIIPRIDPLGAITISSAAGLWSAFCTWRGLEISMTYTVVGSVIGYAIVLYGFFNYSVLTQIVFSWITSPLCAMALSFILYRLVTRLFRNLLNNERFINIVSILLIASLCFSAYSFGINDVGNATGVYVAVTQDVFGLPDDTTMLLLAAFGAIGIAIGGLTWGRRVIETVAFKIVRLDPLSGLAAEITNALIVYLFVTIPYLYMGYGLPVSTSIVGIGAIIGTAFARGQGLIDKSTFGRLVFTWIITLPTTATMSGILYIIVKQIVKAR